MTEEQRREIAYTVVKSQATPQNLSHLSNLHLDIDTTVSTRYDDLKKTSTHFSHSLLEDDTESVVIV